MAQTARVKRQLEVAATAKVRGASRDEARATVESWEAVVNDLEASSDLRSIAVFYRDALMAAVVNGNVAAQDAALAVLSSIAARYQ
jgi:hypothetical protein